MKNELCYLFLGFALLTGTVSAQESAKPYTIRNMAAEHMSVQTSTERLPDLVLNQSTKPLGREDFPLHILSGDPNYTTPAGGLKIEQPNSYNIMGGQPQFDTSGKEIAKELLPYPAATIQPFPVTPLGPAHP